LVQGLQAGHGGAVHVVEELAQQFLQEAGPQQGEGHIRRGELVAFVAGDVLQRQILEARRHGIDALDGGLLHRLLLPQGLAAQLVGGRVGAGKGGVEIVRGVAHGYSSLGKLRTAKGP
jgi:hypothetical protein